MKTTILTISLILITFFAKSQNWKSVPLNDTSLNHINTFHAWVFPN